MVDSGAAENGTPKSTFPEISTEENERVENDSKDQEESISRTMDSKSCRKSTWHVVDVKRPFCIGISHHPSRERAVHWEDEAYIMNRKKNDKSVLRKEGNVHLLDLFVNVPSGATAPIKYMEVDAINQVTDGRDQRKQVTFDCSKPIF